MRRTWLSVMCFRRERVLRRGKIPAIRSLGRILWRSALFAMKKPHMAMACGVRGSLAVPAVRRPKGQAPDLRSAQPASNQEKRALVCVPVPCGLSQSGCHTGLSRCGTDGFPFICRPLRPSRPPRCSPAASVLSHRPPTISTRPFLP